MSPCRSNLSQELERNLHLINAPCSWELSYRMSVTVHDMIHELKSLFSAFICRRISRHQKCGVQAHVIFVEQPDYPGGNGRVVCQSQHQPRRQRWHPRSRPSPPLDGLCQRPCVRRAGRPSATSADLLSAAARRPRVSAGLQGSTDRIYGAGKERRKQCGSPLSRMSPLRWCPSPMFCLSCVIQV